MIEVSRSAELPIELGLVRDALRVDFGDDDRVILQLVEGEIRRYEEFTRRNMMRRVFRFQYPGWFTQAKIDLHPIRRVLGVSYQTPDMSVETAPDTAWQLMRYRQGGCLVVRSDWAAPALADGSGLPVVWFDVEVGTDLPAEAPMVAPLDAADQLAVIHMVKHVYDHDEPLSEEHMRRRFSGRRLLW